MEILIGVIVILLIGLLWYFFRSRTITVTVENEDALVGTKGRLVSLDKTCAHRYNEKEYIGREIKLNGMYVRFLDTGEEKCFMYGYKIRR